MSDHVLSQVEDRMAAILSAYPALATYNVLVAESLDVALEDMQFPALLIVTTTTSFDVADENWQTFHRAEIHVEAINTTPPTGTISRTNRNALAHVLAAIAADRTLGIGIHDIQEDDIAPCEPRGKDVDSASLKFLASWFTPRGDWFTIA